MMLIGIIDIENKFKNVSEAKEKIFGGCMNGVNNLQTFGSREENGDLCFTFSIEDVLVVDTLVSRVRKYTNKPLAFRVLMDGKDVDLSMLK